MKPIRRGLFTAAALLAGVLSSSATVTPQGWWRYGENTDYYADFTANARRFGYGFSCVGSGNAGGVIQPFGCGGPLGNTGATSTSCVLFECGTGSMWGPGGDPGYNPPPTNYVVECWCMPVAPGHNNSWLIASGSGGGVALVLTNDAGGAMFVRAMIIGNGNPTIGDPVALDTTKWTHLAIVNDGGTNTFYVNGVPNGAPDIGHATAPAGVIHAAGDPGSNNEFHGYLDELRISTFAPGAFAISDLLLRPSGPNLLTQPQSITIWDGGAAPFSVSAALDTVSSYQWQRNGVNIPAATSASVVLPQVLLADSGTQVRCILYGGGLSVTSAVATATVVAPNPANINAYRSLVTAESSLLAYFPADGDLGATLTNVKDASHNGTLEGTASYDGRTNRAFGQRALLLDVGGDVKIPNNSAYEFASGNGTIEALVYLSKAPPADATIFSENYDGGGNAYYTFRVGKDGASLVYANDAGASLSWSTPTSFVGQWAHVALVIDHTTNVTAYANGFNLGTKTQPSLGFNTGAPAWIGSSGLTDPAPTFWTGTIDHRSIWNLRGDGL
ncbi:MAG: LamG domain-containing protein [Verrucomicrobia bacterium]|nr:LamG domain-containing protein [Verrucomicrobiota bacterium]